MKKTKIIVPALGMLLLSTAASVTGTVAWFSANTKVSATGMIVQAQAEEGIAIANQKGTDNELYKSTAAAEDGSKHTLLPTSTANLTAWYHNNNADPDSANNSVGEYTVIDEEDYDDYFVMHSFYIRSTSANTINAKLKIDNFAVTGNTGSADLDKCLRAGVKVSTYSAIFAPITGATASYRVNNATDVTAVTTYTTTAAVTIPTNTAQGIRLDVYFWFEGEDANCKSTNIVATLDTLTVSFDVTSVTGA